MESTRVRPRPPTVWDVARIARENPTNASLCPRAGRGERHDAHEHEYIWERATGDEVHGYSCVGTR